MKKTLPRDLFSKRTFRVLLLAGYLITSFWGVPAVITQNTNWAIDTWAGERMGPRAIDKPYIKHTFAMPILPLIVLSYNEFQVGGTFGHGGLEIQIWYGFGVRRVMAYSFWVS